LRYKKDFETFLAKAWASRQTNYISPPYSHI